MTDEQRIADLESQLVEATADNAEFLKSLTRKMVCEHEKTFHCSCTAEGETANTIRHKSFCILAAEHPGSQLLEERERDKNRLEAAEKVIKRLNVEREVVRDMVDVLGGFSLDEETHLALNTIEEAVVKDYDGILAAEHPGSQLLERLEEAKKVVNAFKRGALIGYKALAAYDKAKEPKQ